MNILRKKILIVSIVSLVLSIIILEILSRTPCAETSSNWKSPCPQLDGKYRSDTSYPYVTQIWYPDEKFPINEVSIEKVINEQTVEVDRQEINGANGISCNLNNYVANDLPGKAKRYVKIHEAIHTLGVYNETKTNYTAARKEPLGFIQTTIFSIYHSLKGEKLGNFPCKLGRLWNIFKMYFLNLG